MISVFHRGFHSSFDELRTNVELFGKVLSVTADKAFMYSSVSTLSASASGSYPTSNPVSSATTPSTSSATNTQNINTQSIKTAALNAAAIILNAGSNSVADQTLANTLLKSASIDSMELSLNRLLQTLQPASLLSKLPQVLLDTKVVQARVLQSTLLQSVAPQTTNTATSTLTNAATITTSPAQYRVSLAINLATGQQIIDIALPAPLPQGKWVQLELKANGSALLRNAEAPPTTPLTNKEQQMQIGVRRALPLQQAPEQVIKRLMELIAQPNFAKLPATIQEAVNTLRQQWPTPQQATEPAALQKALNNSGSFYEAKLQQTSNLAATLNERLNKPSTTNTTTAALEKTVTDKLLTNTNIAKTTDQPVDILKTLNQQPSTINDQKAIALNLLSVISQLVKKPNPTGEMDNAELITKTDLIYKKPQTNITQNALLTNETTDDTGAILKELGRLLLSTLARTQINQMDSLQARQGSDNQPLPTATWVLELPIHQGQRTDTLGVRIEQYASKKNNDPRTMQWVVNLQIDLEKLGQLQAQLKVRNQHVKATLWTEQLNTHRLVRKHLVELRQNFERIGVTVEELEVYQGLPNHVPSHSLQRQLIDVHT